MPAEKNPFASPAEFMRIPRLSGIALSPAGDRLVAAVQQPDDEGSGFATSLWALDPAAKDPPRRLTRSKEGESNPAFLPDGSLLFVSSRPRPKPATAGDHPEPQAREDDDAERGALWLLAADGGEPSLLARSAGGISAVYTARHSWTVVVAAESAPGAPSAEENGKWWSERRNKKVSAALFEQSPVRHWDHYLGPEETHLFSLEVDPAAALAGSHEEVALRDLTPDAGMALYECHPALSPDGSTLLVDWYVPLRAGRGRYDIVAIDVATGTRRNVAAVEDGSFQYQAPRWSPDGRKAVALRHSRATITEPPSVDMWLMDVEAGSGRALDPGEQPYPASAVFTADGSKILMTADHLGRAPVFEVDVDGGGLRRLTDEGAFTSLCVSPDGSALYAIRASIDEGPVPVRLSLPAGAGAFTEIASPGSGIRAPGRLEEVTAEALDGTPLRSYLVLPPGASPAHPAPLALFVHGGPLSSWNTWHWRWNPWLLAARGWAVLLPDPALSTGYGAKAIQRGWGQWGGTPFSDLMAITDATLERPDVDATRTAALGGSYGGYMANWIAGHTDRFSAIVSHASVWSLEQFAATTDWPGEWADEWGYPDTYPELYERWSPDRFADSIRTPMLIIHGDRDYRCPVSESMRLWADLTRRAVNAKFLWFADENHWILKPGDAVVWYETVFAFLDHHVLGKEWVRPSLL